MPELLFKVQGHIDVWRPTRRNAATGNTIGGCGHGDKLTPRSCNPPKGSTLVQREIHQAIPIGWLSGEGSPSTRSCCSYCNRIKRLLSQGGPTSTHRSSPGKAELSRHVCWGGV